MRFQIRHLYWILSGPSFAVQQQSTDTIQRIRSVFGVVDRSYRSVSLQVRSSAVFLQGLVRVYKTFWHLRSVLGVVCRSYSSVSLQVGSSAVFLYCTVGSSTSLQTRSSVYGQSLELQIGPTAQCPCRLGAQQSSYTEGSTYSTSLQTQSGVVGGSYSSLSLQVGSSAVFLYSRVQYQSTDTFWRIRSVLGAVDSSYSSVSLQVGSSAVLLYSRVQQSQIGV